MRWKREKQTYDHWGTEAVKYTDQFVPALRSALEWVARRRVTLLGWGLILALLFCCVNLSRAMSTSQATLFLNYAQATEGQCPNGTRFNIYEFKSAEVMERAIASAGLTGRVAPEALADCLTICNGSTTSVSGSADFICTSYSITYTDHLRLPGRSANAMLDLICNAYRDYFMERYTDNQAILSFSDSLFEADEYMMQIDLIRIKTNQLLRYVNGRLKENKDYEDPVSGQSFSALSQRLNHFLQYDTNNFVSFVLESGITADREALLAVLDSRTRMNALDYDRAMASYTVDNEGISIYDRAMSSVAMIPTTDDSRNYYMSRTRTGMDSLATHADEQLASAAETRSIIEYDNYVAEKMRVRRPTRSQIEKADEMIDSLWNDLKRIGSEIQQVDNAYIRQNHREYISFRSDAQSLMDMMDFSSAVIDALLIIFGMLLLRLFGDLFRRRGKKEAGIEP